MHDQLGRLDRRLVALAVGVLAASALLLDAPTALAYPWMIKHAYPGCGSCHVDPTGGEQLTGYGRLISSEVLSTKWVSSRSPEEAEEIPPFARPLFGLIAFPEWFSPGGSARVALLGKPSAVDKKFRVFPMQLDLSAELRIPGVLRAFANVGAARVPEGSPHARAAQVTRGQGDETNLISRTHWLGYDFGDDAHTVRLGRLNLPFGVRIPEHVMWVREQTQTDRESDQQHGLTLAMSFEKIRFEVMGIAGNYQVRPDKFRERGYSAFGELMLGEHVALGLSSLFTFAADDRLDPGVGNTSRQAHGATARIGLGDRLALLAESDVLLRSRRRAGYVAFAQIDYEIVRSLHMIGTAEALDAGAPTVGDEPVTVGRGKPKLGGWLSLQWFVAAHFDWRFDAIVRQSEPAQLLTQVHFYL